MFKQSSGFGKSRITQQGQLVSCDRQKRRSQHVVAEAHRGEEGDIWIIRRTERTIWPDFVNKVTQQVLFYGRIEAQWMAQRAGRV